MTKTNKSFSKRIKVTKKGKVVARKAGTNHFNAKQKRTRQLNAKKAINFSISAKDKTRFLK